MLARIVSRRALGALVGCALAVLGWLLLAPATPVAAIAYTVNTLTDTCAGLSTTGDLCFVINNVNLGSGNDTVTFTVTGTISLTSALPHLTKGVTITGPTSGVTVDGGGTNTVFIVDSGVTANINRLTIANGHGGSGGGILNNGTLTVTNTTFAGNVAPNSGGGIFNNGGTLHVTNSTFSGNSAPNNDGGGIVNFGGSATVTVTNSTFTGNSAARGGGIQNLGSTVTLTNTIVTGNSATSSGPDLANTITSGGHNLFGQTIGATISGGSGDIVNNTPLLGALGSNGGPTQTIPLLPGSPAIAHGNFAVCNQVGTGNVNGLDQRGVPRPTATCAIGAFEPQHTAYTVGSTSDSGNAGTLAACQSATNTTCRLRDALALAPSMYDTETITFNGTVQVPITLMSGTLTVAGNVTITGPASGTPVIVDGGCIFSGGRCQSGGVTVFVVNSGVTVGISNLTIQHGSSSGGGGGIDNRGGTVTLTNSTLSLNSAFYGGGIFNFGGTMTLTNSTLSGNAAASLGGGIDNDNGGMVTVTNSTLSGNSAGNGGGIYNTGGTVTLTNTIVAGSTHGDSVGTISGNNNLIDDTSAITGSNNITNTPAHLGTLGNYGGPTQTIPLLAGSPAIGAGDATAAGCASTGPSGVNGKDQRGLPRAANRCAIGAFEPQQATYTVGSTLDTGAMDTLTDCQTAGNTTCKLRDALAYASSGSDTIVIAPVLTGGQTITLTNDGQHGTLTLVTSVTIAGPTSGAGVVVDGGCMFNGSVCTSGGVRVFLVSGGVTASLSNLTIQHGNNGGGGGGIYNDTGTVTVTNSTLAANSTSGGDGGGIYNNGGPLTVTNSTLTGNSAATGKGAGIYNGGTLTLTNSTLSANVAGLNGGGIYNASGRTLTATNSTLSGNSANNGGGIFNNGGGMATLTNTIVAGNTGTGSGPDLYGTVATGGHNLIGDITNSTGITNGTNGDIVNPAPLLGTLGSNGGPTQTIPLLAGSPAIGAGDASATGCASTGVSGVNGKDQRGFTRQMARCSIGAFEPQTAAYTVGSTSDTGAMDTFANCQNAANTTCKLRDTLAYASSGNDTISFNGTGRGPITITQANGPLTLAASVTLAGPTSGAGVIVDGNGNVKVFSVNSGVMASISNLTIQNGNSPGGNGGGILNNGTLTVTNSTFSGNVASLGGGIYNSNMLTVTNSTFSGNHTNGGGGIINYGSLVVTNSTFSSNSASSGGGIASNGTATLTNTIVAGNTAGASNPDLSGTFISGGHNLIGITSGSGITNGINGDIVNPAPLLGALGSNGGTTQTIPLLAGSPAIAHGDPTVCNQVGTGKVGGVDQRGVTRPTSLCAIGAFEPLLSAIAPASGPIAGGATVTLTGAGFVAGGTVVSIGGAPCTNVQIVNSTTLTCTTGGRGAGTVDVVVTANSQTGTLTGGYTYGVLTPLPPGQPPGGGTGSPSPLPGPRPPGGTTGGPAPNPLPPRRP